MLTNVFFDYFYVGISGFISVLVLIFSFSLLFKMNLIDIISTIITVCVLLIAFVTMIKFYIFGISAVSLFVFTVFAKEVLRQYGLNKQKKNKTEYKTEKE